MSTMDEAKPFCIPKRAVWEAYKRVKENHGAAGVDGQTIEDFEGDLSGNLYKIWNRMCSGSYFPPPVLRVEIPKDNGAGVRPLGIPTVSDRIAQTVGKNYLEPILEEIFDEDSYGYRPGRSAKDAIGMARTDVWVMTGFLSLTSDHSSIILITICFCERYATTLIASGCCCMSSGGSRLPCNWRTGAR